MTDFPPPSAESLRRAQLIWRQSEDDLRSARSYLRRGEALEACFNSLQTVVNSLSALSILAGHFQLPHHSPLRLLEMCVELDERFSGLQEACAALEGVQEQDPFRSSGTPEDIAQQGKQSVEHATAIQKAVRNYLKEHRKRFFAP